MCWYSRKPVLKIADVDIKVYKVMKCVYHSLYSFYYLKHYELNKEYNLDKNIPLKYNSDGVGKIEEGFHSYIEYECVEKHKSMNQPIYKIKINKFISYSTTVPHAICIAECTIPKGSYYYINLMGEVVSNRIIINNFKLIKNINPSIS